MNPALDARTPDSDHYFLERGTPETIRTLESGTIARDGKTIDVRAVAVRALAGGGEEILFRRRSPTPARNFAERAKRFTVAIRAFSLTATFMPCLAALLLGIRGGAAPELGVALPALAGVLLLQVSVNLYNDVSDYLKLIDLPGSPGGSGVFELGWFTPREIRNCARATLILGIAAGLPALARHPLEILAMGGLGIVGTILYSHPRFGLKYHALGDLAVFVLCGPALAAGFAWATFGAVSGGVLAAGSFLGLLACALLHVNNFHDMELDRSRGVTTLAIRLGFEGSWKFLGFLYGAAIAILFAAVAFGMFPATALLATIVALPAGKLYRRIRTSLGPHSPTLEGARIDAAKIHLLAGALLSAGLFASRWIGG